MKKIKDIASSLGSGGAVQHLDDDRLAEEQEPLGLRKLCISNVRF